MLAIIVDDEMHCRRLLQLMLEKHCPAVTIVAVCPDGITAVAAIEKYKPDLLFLDIEMPGMNGFEVLQACPGGNFSIVFTTAYFKYALGAIRHNALDYLMKPIIKEELQEAVDKALLRQLQQKDRPENRVDSLLEVLHQHLHPGERLALPSQEGLRMLLVKDILYCATDGVYTRIHLQNSSVPALVSSTLKDVEAMLRKKGFFRVHHSFLVNLSFMDRYIKGDGGEIIMSDGSCIPVSRNRKQAFMEKLAASF